MATEEVRALVKPCGRGPEWRRVDPSVPPDGAVDVPVAGTVYGVALNVRRQVERLSGAFAKAPYTAPPRAPVLYIKTPNTFRPHGGIVPVPDAVEELEVAASLALVIGRTACRVSEARALDHVLGYALAIDVCVPHDSFYRPAIRQRCRDGFLPLGPWIVDKDAVADPDGIAVELWVNDERRDVFSTADLVRLVARLIADVTDFMTLSTSDVLLAGLSPDAPRARVGDRVSARAEGIGWLDCRLGTK